MELSGREEGGGMQWKTCVNKIGWAGYFQTQKSSGQYVRDYMLEDDGMGVWEKRGGVVENKGSRLAGSQTEFSNFTLCFSVDSLLFGFFIKSCYFLIIFIFFIKEHKNILWSAFLCIVTITTRIIVHVLHLPLMHWALESLKPPLIYCTATWCYQLLFLPLKGFPHQGKYNMLRDFLLLTELWESSGYTARVWTQVKDGRTLCPLCHLHIQRCAKAAERKSASAFQTPN